MVARLTPDQKAACSSHVGVNIKFWLSHTYMKTNSANQKVASTYAETRIRTWVTAATTQGPNH